MPEVPTEADVARAARYRAAYSDFAGREGAAVDGNAVPFPLPERARRQLLQGRQFLQDGA